MITKIFDHKAKSINLAALILGAASFISAVLGFFRDRLLASRFGVGDELDVYYVSFRIPDFISMVLIMGAISAAIVPIFSQYLSRSKKEAFDFLANLFNLFLLFLIIVIFVLIIFTPQLISLIAPGFSGQKKELTVLLTRIMFLSPIFLGLSNIFSAILQIFQRFLITSLAPIIYNVGIIFGILFFVPKMGVVGLAWGVVLGAFLHFLLQAPIIFKLGFQLKKILNFKEPGFLQAIKLTIPRSIGLAAGQINLIFITAVASTLFSGSIAVFNLADSLSRPLLTFIGVSFSTAAFPSLAMAFAARDKEKFNRIFSQTFFKTIYLILPLSFLLFLFRDLIIKIILKVGKFSSTDAQLTAACLAAFSLGIFAQALILLLAKAFFAFHDTRTPAAASILGMVFNIFFVIVFVKLFSFPNFFQKFFLFFFNISDLKNFEVVALPLAISFSAIFQFLILFLIFKRKKEIFFKKS